jgi:transposase
MVPYSIDLRERILAAVDAGQETQEQIAGRFTGSTRWIRTLAAQRAQTGRIGPEPNPGDRKPLIEGETAQALRETIAKDPDATLDDLRQVIGFDGCTVTVWRAIERRKIPRIKSRCGRRSSSTRRAPPRGRRGPSGWGWSTQTGSSSSTRSAPRRP